MPVNAVCLLCGAGQEAASGQGTCSDCPGGKYATANDVACRLCEAGKYSAGGAAQCDECPGGKNLDTGPWPPPRPIATTARRERFPIRIRPTPRPEPASGVIPDVTHTKAAKFVAHRVRQAPELWGTCLVAKTVRQESMLNLRRGVRRTRCAWIVQRESIPRQCGLPMRARVCPAPLRTFFSLIISCDFLLGSDANTDCMSCNTMIGEYVDFDAEICRRCSWPFGLYTAAENGRVVCGPCPLGELPQMTNCVEPVDGVLETQVLQACNTRHCRQTPGFLQVWHFTISQASDVVYHRLDYTLPALFQRASHPVDLGRNQPPGLAPGRFLKTRAPAACWTRPCTISISSRASLAFTARTTPTFGC